MAMRFQDEAGMPERRKGINVEVVDGQIDRHVASRNWLSGVASAKAPTSHSPNCSACRTCA